MRATVDECLSRMSQCTGSGESGAVVDECQAGASLSTWYGRAGAKVDEHWAKSGRAGPQEKAEGGEQHQKKEISKNGTPQHQASKEGP